MSKELGPRSCSNDGDRIERNHFKSGIANLNVSPLLVCTVD